MTFEDIENTLRRSLPSAYKDYINRMRRHYGVPPNHIVSSDLQQLLHINKTLREEALSPSVSKQVGFISTLFGSKPKVQEQHPFVASFEADLRFVIGGTDDIVYYLECVDSAQTVYQYQLSSKSVLRTFQQFDEFTQYVEELAAGVEGKGFLA